MPSREPSPSQARRARNTASTTRSRPCSCARVGGISKNAMCWLAASRSPAASSDRNLTFTSPEGKEYRLNDKVATMLVRPRGWHLEERHVLVGGKPVSGSLFDFGLYFFHNAKRLIAKGSGPYFYLPKLESHLEARLWNDV